MKQFILSDLSNSEKKKALDSGRILFKKYHDLGLTPPNHFIPIFECIVNKKYDNAISLADGLVDLMRFQEKIPNPPKSEKKQIEKVHSTQEKGKYNTKNYKISIILPIFNVEDYIKDALKSIVNQTIGLEHLEVIMVDDCSTDKSGEIMDEYANKYENFTAIHLPENSGAAGKPRNVGMEKATGDYLMFLDPDDYYTDNACEILYNKIVEEDVDIVFGKYYVQYENGKKLVPSYQLCKD